MRDPTGPARTAALAVVLVLAAGCRNSDATATPETLPATTTTAAAETAPTQAMTTTSLPPEQAAYNVYRTFLDTSLAIGIDFNRKPDDGSLDPFTTLAYRRKIILNLQGLKANGITQKGQFVQRLMSSQIEGNKAVLQVCSRDDVDQFDRTGKQLSPPGPGMPELLKVGLLKEGTTWLLDGVVPTGEPCDV